MAGSAIGVGAVNRFPDDLPAGINVYPTFGKQRTKALLVVERAAKRAMAIRRRANLELLKSDTLALCPAMHANPKMVTAHDRQIVDNYPGYPLTNLGAAVVSRGSLRRAAAIPGPLVRGRGARLVGQS